MHGMQADTAAASAAEAGCAALVLMLVFMQLRPHMRVVCDEHDLRPEVLGEVHQGQGACRAGVEGEWNSVTMHALAAACTRLRCHAAGLVLCAAKEAFHPRTVPVMELDPLDGVRGDDH